MTYEELVEKARQTYGRADASGIEGHLAYQFNITGEAEGAFYLEISDGQIKIEPYEYYDRDVLFTMSAKTLIKLGTGALDPVLAYTTGKLKVQGSLDKALLLKKLTVPADEADVAEEAVSGTDATEEASVETEAEEETASADKAVSTEETAGEEACVKEEAPTADTEEAEEASSVKEASVKPKNGKWKGGKAKKKR